MPFRCSVRLCFILLSSPVTAANGCDFGGLQVLQLPPSVHPIFLHLFLQNTQHRNADIMKLIPSFFFVVVESHASTHPLMHPVHTLSFSHPLQCTRPVLPSLSSLVPLFTATPDHWKEWVPCGDSVVPMVSGTWRPGHPQGKATASELGDMEGLCWTVGVPKSPTQNRGHHQISRRPQKHQKKCPDTPEHQTLPKR